MKRVELERMTLEELYRAAAERGVREAAGLPREALIDRLAARVPTPSPTQPAVDHSRQTGQPAHSDGARRANFRNAMIPSGVAPDRPSEHDPEDMARLYLEQGEPARAADLFRELLVVRPDDESLVVGLALAEARLRELSRFTPGHREVEQVQPAHPGEPMGMLDLEEPPASYGIDECELIAKDPHSVFVYWEVTDQGLATARRDLGEEADAAKLVMRLIATAGPGEPGGDREGKDLREIRDHHIDWNQGRRYFPSPRAGARVRAAVGLLCPSGLFVPVAHSSQSRVPPEGASGPVSAEWMEVDPEHSRGRERELLNARRRRTDYSERGVGTPASARAREEAEQKKAATTPGSSPSSPWRWRPGSQS